MSDEVAEHMTVIPVALFLLLDPVETLVSVVGNSVVGRGYLNGAGHLFRNCILSPFFVLHFSVNVGTILRRLTCPLCKH